MKELLIIPCSQRKIIRNKKDKTIRNFHKDIEKKQSKKLLDLRNQLRTKIKSQFLENQSDHILAYRRYSGSLYKQIEESTWFETEKNDDKEIIIISALYGIIYWNEIIDNYNLSMSDKISNRTLSTWWKRNNLKEIVAEYINKSEFGNIRSFLSIPYKNAIEGIENLLNPNIKWLNYKYSELGSGSNHYRGKDLKNTILGKNIKCPSRNCQSVLTRRISKDIFECTECGKKYIPHKIFKVQASKLVESR